MQDLTIGKSIKAARINLELSQQVLATRAGIALRTLSRIESGEDMNTATLSALAGALGLSIADLLAEQETVA